MAGCGNVVSSCWNVRTACGAGAFHSSPISLLTFSHFLSHGMLVTFIYSWGPHLWPQFYKKLESPHYLYSPCEKLHNYALFWEWRISSFGMALMLCYGFGNRKTEVDCQLMSSWSCSTASVRLYLVFTAAEGYLECRVYCTFRWWWDFCLMLTPVGIKKRN
jgi:hypothetical protein